MNSFVLSIQQYRQSVAALTAVVFCMLFSGYLWSVWYMQEPIRLEQLRKDNCVEVVVEGIGTDTQHAEDNAKGKAVEKAKGLFIKSNNRIADKNTSTTTSEDTRFTDTQESEVNIQSHIEAYCRSVDYLKYWKDKDGIYHVKIRSVVEKQNK